MSELQKLIADFIASTPGESYSTIARRGGMNRQTPFPDTITRLAKGMNLPESVVREAAHKSAGYQEPVTQERQTDRGRMIVAALEHLDPARLDDLERRAAHLLAEMREAEERRQQGD